MTNKLTEEQIQKLVQNVPMGRMGTPEDIAKVVGFLCSNDADYITGQVIAVDGGMTM
jgi:3-oxoacyl-[acyl-carrier protein] reductase